MTRPVVDGSAPHDPGALIVVADSVRAQVFVADGAHEPLREAGSLLNPQSRLHERDLVTDGHGRRNHRPTQGASAGDGRSAREHYADMFAGRLCRHMERELDRHPGRRLYVVAEPQFLGLLRRRMEQRIGRQVVAEVPKAVTGRRPQDIRDLLPARL